MPDLLAHPDETIGDELELLVDGTTYRGWKSVAVGRSLERAAGKFTVATSTSSLQPFPVKPGAEVSVRLAGGVVLVTGLVDSLAASSSGSKRTVEIAGRDRTAQLVDCTANLEAGEFVGLELDALVRELAAPFNVDVVRKLGLLEQGPAFPTYSVQQGEKAWAAIERACRQRGVLAISDGLGRLVLTKPATGRADTSLVEGRNIKASSVRYTHADRFSIYYVKGQDKGSDQAWGSDVSEIVGTALDPEVKANRPLLVVAEGTVSFESAKDRAQWEATVRAARSVQVKVTAVGWRQGDPRARGRAWEINELVPVQIASLGVKADLLVQAVQFKNDAQSGRTTELTLTRADAYTPQPEVREDANPFANLLGDDGFTDGFDLDSGEDF